MYTSKSNMTNDCIAIVMWFYRNQNKFQSLTDCAREVGLSTTTIRKYVHAYKYYGPENYFLANVGYKIGYKVRYVGKRGNYVFVEKLKY